MKKFLIISLVLLLILIVGCSNAANDDNDIVPEKSFTLEELATYNGKNGNPAYIAVDGIIYDVTNVSQWKNGMHNGYDSGKDLTYEIMEKSPHGISKLKGIPKVGKLAE